ncbi:MAG TPA: SprT family zinc-dependent metalloprotease [Caulobacterales bacterium]|nr:SprT family zinc-dependent metalloprotease [Caulobacterales bacterium]
MRTIRAPFSKPPTTVTVDAEGSSISVRLIINPRARRIAVRIDPTKREAVAVSPSSRQCNKAAAFAAERAVWIAHQLAQLPEAAPFAPGALLPIRGVEYRLKRVDGRAPATLEKGPVPRLIIGAPDADIFATRVKRFLMAEAKADFTRRIAAHAATLRVTPAGVQIKDTRSRWGSCTADGVLAFSWRVILAPPYVLDYLAAHEVAHLVEMNHSTKFWSLVRKCCPDYVMGRNWLRNSGQTLHAYGAAA